MSIVPLPTPEHPVLAATEAIEAALDSVAEVNPTFMRTGAKAESLRRLALIESRVAALRLHILADAGDVAIDAAARDAGAWYSRETRTAKADGKRDLALAEDLDRRWTVVAAGLRDGAVTLTQARVIVAALDRLPAEVPSETVAGAEGHLVAQAVDFGPEDLAKLGRRILDVVAPQIAEGVEARALAAEETEAHEQVRGSIRRRGNGITRIVLDVPDLVGTRFAVYLQSHTNPRQQGVPGEAASPGPADPVDSLPPARKVGQAFCALVENLDPARLPIHGGDATTLVLTMGLDDLSREHALGEVLSTAALGGDRVGTSRGGGDLVTAGQIRRLACNATIIPVVLGGRSEVLVQGRGRRLFTKAQRKALLLRDRHCRAEGCDIPGTWAEAHHWIWWTRGGPTDLDNAVLLCSHHHHRAHDARYQADRLANGDVRFTRRR